MKKIQNIKVAVLFAGGLLVTASQAIAQTDTAKVVIKKSPKVIILKNESEKKVYNNDSSNDVSITLRKITQILRMMSDSISNALPDTTIVDMDMVLNGLDSAMMMHDKLSTNSEYRIEEHIEFHDEPEYRRIKRHWNKVETAPELSFGISRMPGITTGTPINGVYQNGMAELNAAKSLQVGIGQSWGYNLYRGKWRAWGGLKYYMNNYRFRNPSVRIEEEKPAVAYRFADSGFSEKSKVVVNYLCIPVAIGYSSGKHRNLSGFWFKAGADAGLQVRAHSKTVIKNQKNKTFDDFNFNDVDIAPFVQVGYNSFALYVRMHQTGLFKDSQGPDVKQYNVGISMIF